MIKSVSFRGFRVSISALVLSAVLAGLTMHTLLLTLLVGAMHPSPSLVTALSAWKEALALVASGALLATAATGGLRRSAWTGSDVIITAFLIVVGVGTAISLTAMQLLPRGAVLLGVRFYLVPLAVYCIGRLLPLRMQDVRVVLTAVVVLAGITAVGAFGERLIPDAAFVQLVNSIGYKTYFGDYVHQQLTGPGPTAASMWVDAGRGIGRRAGSLYLVSKPFGLALLFAAPIALGLLAKASGRIRLALWLLTALIGLGLALSYTRAVVAAACLVGIAVALLTRRWQVLPALAIGLGLGLAMYATEVRYVNPAQGLRPSVMATDSGSLGGLSNPAISLPVATSSDSEHAEAWQLALKAGLKKPILGWGPGTGNEDSQRFVSPGGQLPVTLGAESLFLQIFEELGVIGLGLYLAVLGSVAIVAWRTMATPGSTEEGRLIPVAAIALTVGVLAAGVSTPVWSGAFVMTYGYWWLAGVSSRQSAQANATPRQAVAS